MKDSHGPAGEALERAAAGQAASQSRHARLLARRQSMAQMVVAEGTVRIEAITERFGISLMTAHRDLDELVSRGLLRKTRGVVSAAPNSLIESSDVYRAQRQAAEKRAIAKAAARLCRAGTGGVLRRFHHRLADSCRISARGCRSPPSPTR